MFKVVRQPFFNAEGDMGGGGNPAAATSSSDLPVTQNWGLPAEGNQAAAAQNPLFQSEQTAQPEPTAAQVFDFAGRKVEIADPTVAAALKNVHKDYSELTSTYQNTNQRVKELEQANQTYMQLLQNMQQQQPAQANPTQPQQNQPTEEDIAQMKADFMESFYDDPRSAIEGMLDTMFQQKVQPIIEPITQERQWNEQVAELQKKYPSEFPSLIGPMQELLREMPELSQHGLEGVFQIAKRAQQPNPEQLLSDPQFVQQVMQNPDIQKQFLSQYLQEKQGSQQQAPTMIGGQPGGQMPTTPEQRPTNIKDATKAFKRHLGLFG